MVKTKEQLAPNNAPVYAAALYPSLAAIAHDHGYALAVHGSVARDFDLIAVPWAEKVSRPATLIEDICAKFAVELIGDNPGRKNHGRRAYTLSVGFGECAVDLSFLNRMNVASRDYKTK